MPISRRIVLKSLGMASFLTARIGAAEDEGTKIAGRAVEVSVTPIGPSIVRISVAPIEGGRPQPIPADGSLVRLDWGAPILRLTSLAEPRVVDCGDSRVTVSGSPLTIRIEAKDGRLVQRLRVDAQTGSLAFDLGDGPVLGLGEGGPQFDRRGSADRMRSGQGGYRLRTHGGRVPIPWLIGTSGWAMFIHRPYGSVDLTGGEGKYIPRDLPSSLPLDVFVVTSREPARVMAEYARLTGFPEMPPLWSLGYQQSHRTLASREEILAEARTFREKKLPCDTMIYLGTGFCPSGWNTGHGSWDFNPAVFPEPKAEIDALRAPPFPGRAARRHPGEVGRAARSDDPFDPAVVDESSAASYWNAHRKVEPFFDGWWPDEGDPLDIPSRLSRIRMYYEGEQLDRPDARPFALHRNGYAGMQRYAAFLWSGDVYSTWETLKTHVPIAINTGLTGIPLWGTDIGGFVPTKEFTGELFVRWFQFAAFCPSFRSHGRTWKLRLPWGWNTGELGPDEVRAYGDAANPGPRGAAQRGRRADLSQVPGTPLSPHALPLQRRPRGARDGPADHPIALAPSPRRPGRSGPGRRIPLGPRPAGRPGDREGGDVAAGSISRGGPGTTSGPRRSSKAAARSTGPSTWRRSPCSPGPGHHSHGPGQAVHRRARRRPDDPVPLPRRRRRVHALRRRRHHVRLSQGRLDGHRDGLGRPPAAD